MVLFDRLVSDEILNMVAKDAVMVYVGKTAGRPCLSQVGKNTRRKC